MLKNDIYKIKNYLENSLYPNWKTLKTLTPLSKSYLQGMVKKHIGRMPKVIMDPDIVLFDKYDFKCAEICRNTHIKPGEYKYFMFKHFGHYGDYFEAYKKAYLELEELKRNNGKRKTVRRYNKCFAYSTLNTSTHDIDSLNNRINENKLLKQNAKIKIRE